MPRSSNAHIEILTRRLRLRRFEARDRDGLHACFGDPESMRYWDSPATKTPAETARWVRKLAKATTPEQSLAWAVAERKSDTCIGMVDYHHRAARHHRVEVGYILAPRARGRGLMAEALRALLGHCFDALEIHRVEAMIHPDNTRSVRVVERLGFRREGGPLRERWRVGDTWQSADIFSLLAGELIDESGGDYAHKGGFRPRGPRRGFLRVGAASVPCALGRSGVTARKREGDGATPSGRFPSAAFSTGPTASRARRPPEGRRHHRGERLVRRSRRPALQSPRKSALPREPRAALARGSSLRSRRRPRLQHEPGEADAGSAIFLHVAHDDFRRPRLRRGRPRRLARILPLARMNGRTVVAGPAAPNAFRVCASSHASISAITVSLSVSLRRSWKAPS